MVIAINAKRIFLAAFLAGTLALGGCASVPTAPKEQDTAAKTFTPPKNGNAGLYIFRNSLGGQAFKRMLSVDGKQLGESANKVYFYTEVAPGPHTVSTASEFSDNSVEFKAESGKNYFARQYMRFGVFVAGTGIEMVPEEEGKKEVLECELAAPLANTDNSAGNPVNTDTTPAK